MIRPAMEMSDDGLSFLERWEVYVGYVYDDKVPMRRVKGKLAYPEYKGGPVRGTLTIGIGHTKAAHAKVDMSIGAKMTHDEARRVLGVDLDPCEACVNKYVKVELTQGQFDALVSFVYNCGEGTFLKSSILRKLNQGNYAGARAAFDLYTMSKGEHMVGLQRRRDAEQVLWDERADIAKFMPDAGETVEHPADVDEPETKSMAKSTEGWTSVAQAGAGTAGDIKEGFDASAAADKVIDAKDKAEQLGVQPIELFEKAQHIVGYLIHSPTFWFCTAVTLAGIYLYFRRKWRLKEEV